MSVFDDLRVVAPVLLAAAALALAIAVPGSGLTFGMEVEEEPLDTSGGLEVDGADAGTGEGEGLVDVDGPACKQCHFQVALAKGRR